MKKLKSQFKKYLGKEDDFQISVARLLDSIPSCLWCHVNNEGLHKPQYRAKMAAKGLKPGVPDILIFNQSKMYKGFAIELKVGYNKPTEYQSTWQDRLNSFGWKTLTTHSLDEAINEIENYFSINQN